MKKNYFFLISSILIYFSSNAQSPPWAWVKQGGSTGIEDGREVARDPFGNVYVVGAFSGTATFGSTVITSNGARDIFVAKYDSSGTLIWIQHHGGAGDDFGDYVAIDSMGNNIFVTGFYSGTVTFGTYTIPSAGSQDIFVAKYNSAGTVQWVQHGGSAVGVSYGYAITYDEANQFVYVSGSVGASAQFNSVTYTNAYLDVLLAKYSLSGNLMWVKFFGGPSDDAGNDITCDALGNVYIAGYSKSIATFGSYTVTSPGAQHSFIVAKCDSSGTVLWVSQGTGGTVNNDAYGVSIDNATGYVNATGDISGTVDFSSNIITSYGNNDIVVVQYDSAGNLRWVKRAGSTGTDAGYSVKTDNQSSIYVTGKFSDTTSFVDTSITGVGGTDIFLAKYDSSGTCLWVQQAGGVSDDLGWSLAISNPADEIYVSGTFIGPASFESINLNGYGAEDFFVGKLSAPIIEGVNELQDGNFFILYPNPSGGSFTFSFQNALKSGTIEIFNSIGQEIYSEKISGSISRKEINLNTTAGIYFVKVSDREKVLTQKLIIQ